MKLATAAAILAATAATSTAFLSPHSIHSSSLRRTRNDAPSSSSLLKSTVFDPQTTGKSVGISTGFGINGSSSANPKAAAQKYLNTFVNDTAAHIIYSKLLEHNVEVVNGYSGGAILPLLDQFHRKHPRHGDSKTIRWITNSNESSAGHVAEGIAKSSTEADGKLAAGVVVATSGPGATNLVTPVADALCDGVPLLVLCGQAATTAPTDAFQSAPAVEIMRPITKWSYQIKNAAEVPFAMDYAFYIARNGRPGPVFLDLPKDLQIQQLSEELISKFLDGLPMLGEDGGKVETRVGKEDFVRLIPDTSAIHLGSVDKGLSFQVDEEGKLQHVESGHDAYHLDHHNTDTIYSGVDYDNIYEKTEGRKMSKLGAEDGLMKDMMGLIKNAKRPFIIAGQGANDASEELMELAETLQIPVATTLHALGTFDERHELATNMVGMHGHATPNYLVQDCDLLICIGSRFDDRITGRPSDFLPAARQAEKEGRGGIIHVDVRFSENAKQVKPTYFVHSTGKAFLQAVNKEIRADPPKRRSKQWIEKKFGLEAEYPIKITKYNPEKFTISNDDGSTSEVTRTRICTQSVIAEMNRQLLETGKIDDSIFSTGVGIHQMAAAQLITWTKPRQMLSSGSLGTMGVSTGYCMGAKLANPTKICISIDGDGSFNMTFTELKTIGDEKIPVKLMILDNESQMMVEYWQRLFHDKRYIAVRNKSPEYCTLASAFGIKSIYCDNEEELEEKMRSFLFDYDDEPVLFHVRIERTPCLPMVAPGQPLDNMILVDEDFEVDKSAAPS
eukprot:scaffold40933_cov49-Cyclotella_meneghiniana.AAC.1